jgi:hypothetical protein
MTKSTCLPACQSSSATLVTSWSIGSSIFQRSNTGQGKVVRRLILLRISKSSAYRQITEPFAAVPATGWP